MRQRGTVTLLGILISLGVPLLYMHTALAATGDINTVENFMRSIIQLMVGLAGLVATGFFVFGGFQYITSSGKPENMEKAKRTLQWSAVGLAIVIAAFVISNIITTLATNAFGK